MAYETLSFTGHPEPVRTPRVRSLALAAAIALAAVLLTPTVTHAAGPVTGQPVDIGGCWNKPIVPDWCQPDGATVPTRHLDGRTIFRGVFAGEGPVADLFRTPAQPAPPADLPTATTALMDDIERHDPEFFRRFATLARSGDPVQVRRAMTEGRDLITTIVDGTATRPGAGLPIYRYIDIYKDIYLYEVFALVQYGAFYQGVWWWANVAGDAPRSALERDARVARIATALRA